MPIQAQFDVVPTPDGGSKKYQGSGKLNGLNAIITGGDSGIGRATALLFAHEGANSFIAYLPEEQEDAEWTKKHVEELGQKCTLFPTDLTKQENCQKVIDEAVKAFGGTIDILFNNHAYQMICEDIKDLKE
jgi:NAD(P)-dependent dehydrogenase (short-subunit alcohol dehydrogenase family)